LLQIFYSIRSERLLMEQLDYKILFRWFVGLAMDEPILNQDLARDFLQRVVARVERYMSDASATVVFQQAPSKHPACTACPV
jgi:transposase